MDVSTRAAAIVARIATVVTVATPIVNNDAAAQADADFTAIEGALAPLEALFPAPKAAVNTDNTTFTA